MVDEQARASRWSIDSRILAAYAVVLVMVNLLIGSAVAPAMNGARVSLAYAAMSRAVIAVDVGLVLLAIGGAARYGRASASGLALLPRRHVGCAQYHPGDCLHGLPIAGRVLGRSVARPSELRAAWLGGSLPACAGLARRETGAKGLIGARGRRRAKGEQVV